MYPHVPHEALFGAAQLIVAVLTALAAFLSYLTVSR